MTGVGFRDAYASKNSYDPYDVKGTKLKRLKLGQLGEEEKQDGEDLDEGLVKEARKAIGYLQLDLPTQN